MLARGSESDWIPLMDYAMKRGISLSTLRRHIKSKKIPYKIENGRYLLLDDGFSGARSQDDTGLMLELQKAREEIAELKTLIAFYEERLPQARLDV